MAPRHLPWGGDPGRHRVTYRCLLKVNLQSLFAGICNAHTHTLALITNGPGRVMCVCVCVWCFPFLFCTTAAQSLAFLGSYTKQKSATVRDGLVGRGWYEECLLYSPGWPRMHECVAGRPTPTVHLPYWSTPSVTHYVTYLLVPLIILISYSSDLLYSVQYTYTSVSLKLLSMLLLPILS